MVQDDQVEKVVRNSPLWFRLLRALLLAAMVTVLFAISAFFIACPKDNSGWCGLLPILGGLYVFIGSLVILLFTSIMSRRVKVQLIVSVGLVVASILFVVLFMVPQ